MADVVVTKVDSTDALDTWIAVPRLTLPREAPYTPPLRHAERRRLSRAHNPFFARSQAELFLAWRDCQPVGRISAQVNERYLARHADGRGHFGFFDSINDQEVAKALIEAAAGWLRARGMRGMSGPFNLSINEECGLLVEGFETAPAVMMPYSAPWQGGLAQASGLAPEMDLHAYRMSPQKIPPLIRWLADTALTDSTVTIRQFDTRRFDDELALLVDIFNDAWSDNWGFVPFEVDDLRFSFGELKPFFRSKYGRFIYVDGAAAGFGLSVPNINEIIAGFDGRLLPFNWLKLIVGLGFEHFRSGRLPLLGLRKRFQGTPRAASLFAALVKVAIDELRDYDIDWAELSWVLSSNKPLITFLNAHFGPPSQKYRLYGHDF